jgi:transcriptional regulator EpsA
LVLEQVRRNEAVSLTETDWMRFYECVDGSFEVMNRQQFFVWTQSALQGLVPHQILLCGFKDPAKQTMPIHHFSASRYFKDEHIEALGQAQQGLVPLLARATAESGADVVFSPDTRTSATTHAIHRLVDGNELKNLAATVIRDIDGQMVAFYGFGRVSADFTVRLTKMIDLVSPYVHSTFMRVLTKERGVSQTGEAKPGRVITPRQVEILMLIRDGKTNAEIAEMLACSQWTIKNHIQNILQRLDTKSRTHALMRAMRMGILRAE